MKDGFQDVFGRSIDEMKAAIDRNDPNELPTAVIGVALYHDDPVFAQDVCVELATHEHDLVRGNAVLGFGHIARRCGSLDEGAVRPIIESALNDRSDYVRGQAWAAAEDVCHFLGWNVSGFSG